VVYDQGIFVMKIEELNLSVRSTNLLKRKGIAEVEILLSMTDEEIIGLYDGRKAMGEIREAIMPMREAMREREQ